MSFELKRRENPVFVMSSQSIHALEEFAQTDLTLPSVWALEYHKYKFDNETFAQFVIRTLSAEMEDTQHEPKRP